MNTILKDCLKVNELFGEQSDVSLMEELGINPLLVKQARLKEFNPIVITFNNIKKFLSNECYKVIPNPDNFKNAHIYHNYCRDYEEGGSRHITREISYKTYMNVWGEGKYYNVVRYWLEVPIKEITEPIPTNCLYILKEWKSRNVFERFTVATVENENSKKIPDPFLIGRINGDSNRYFLAQWGGDINIDNVV